MFITVLLMSAPVAGSEAVPPPPPAQTGNVTGLVHDKVADAVFMNERRFVVPEDTQIWSLSGKPIELKDLPVPCKAEILYRLLPGQEDPVCQQLKVKWVPKSE